MDTDVATEESKYYSDENLTKLPPRQRFSKKWELIGTLDSSSVFED